ncbi:WD domain, G-beta repeat [Rubripirellula lacrimiformis]|uniref:WD domain, G-beta repeat n=1 Tax=Rubripirellula lacrimiformis TaxID=1930273 RepID=A0A517N7Z0_9BACT|nr:hypothetical protein [Rubripirellula lacrimiformis]QDT03257.1 WD domain, G-beta repeat [Rubripirellula lacrimiformis]
MMMHSILTIRKPAAFACLLAVFGLGVAAERYRRYWTTNVGDWSVQRTDPLITLAIDGTPLSNWQAPVHLRAGPHQLHATWRDFRVETTVNVKRGDEAARNQIRYSLRDDQLQVEFNLQLIDVVPRPEPEVCSIQTASGNSWHTADSGEIALRALDQAASAKPASAKLASAEPYTIHWLRPDRSEAFIQSSDGRFVTHTSSLRDSPQGVLKLSGGNDWPSVFKVARVEGNEPWITLAAGQHFVDAGADPKRVRTTVYELFASPHFFSKTTDDVKNAKPPLPPAVPVIPATLNSLSVRRFKGHTDVIRAVVFTPDGRHIISASEDGTIRFWNVKNGKQVDVIQTHRPALSLAISSDGESLACGMADAVVKIWKLDQDPSMAHRDERILARDSRGDVLSIAFSPDDTRVAAGGNDQQHTRIWNLLTPDERCQSSLILGPVTSLAWSATGGRLLLCTGTRSLHWWPPSKGLQSRDFRSGKLLIRSGNRPLVVVAGEILDAETLEVVHSFTQRQGVRAVSAQTFDPSKMLVTADKIVNTIHEMQPDELVSVWDLTSGQPVAVLRDRPGQVGNIAISPGGELVAYGNGQNVASTQPQPTGDYDLRVWKIIHSE